MKHLLGFATKALKDRSVRSWITIFGIVISIAVIYILLTLSSGLQSAVVRVFEDLGTDRLYVFPTGTQIGLTSFPNTIVDDIESLGLFRKVIPMSATNGIRVEYKNREIFTSIYGMPNTDVTVVAQSQNFDTDLIEGRFWHEGERKVAVIGYNVAKDPDDVLFGQEVGVRRSILINGTRFVVIGIYKQVGSNDDNYIYIPQEDALPLFNKEGTVDVIDALLKPTVSTEAAKERVDRLLEKKLGEDTYQVFTPEGIIRQFTSILFIVQALLLAIASVSLLVGAIGIANTMFTSVLEREKEIGIMKSIGAQNRDILALFMIESGLIGLIGGTAGVVFGIGGSFLIGSIVKQIGFQYLDIQLQPLYILFCLAFAFIVGMLSGFLPSYLGSRKKIVDSLRDS